MYESPTLSPLMQEAGIGSVSYADALYVHNNVFADFQLYANVLVATEGIVALYAGIALAIVTVPI